MNDREPTSHERMSRQSWDASYTNGPAPWNIGGPQPAIARLLETTRLDGPVLDAGCGGGENALLIASKALPVVGFDVAEAALTQARSDAAKRGYDVEFVTADALNLQGLGRTFATVIDSGLLHSFDAGERRRYAKSLAGVTDPRGTLYVLAFSNEGENAGPHPLRKTDFVEAFDASTGWDVISVEADRVMTRYHDDEGAPAWFATIRRIAG
jgi:ubiquinone/menaquinone biosynthesis C-methylase UbiE